MSGAVVIDVGIHHTGTGLTGDVRFADVSRTAGWIRPVPGGVGAMTIAMLLSNPITVAESGRSNDALAMDGRYRRCTASRLTACPTNSSLQAGPRHRLRSLTGDPSRVWTVVAAVLVVMVSLATYI
ncbi:hypothetical protein [Streptomyces sp. 3213.3]|uniref:hypothetical protein n=1 Tax=Streptomyces sp. 3213.3 TaxID=1855348 RepID=UPI000AEDB8CF|nr:hypothetical protein [Streptomyces sp. 3213.3]